MDDAIGPIVGTVLVIIAIIYFIQFIILAALILVPMVFVGREFTRQLTQRYRLSLVSGVTLILVGVSSLLLAYILLKAAGDYRGEWAYLLAAPIFLCLATATLGLWGMAKLSHLMAAVGKAERQAGLGVAEISNLEGPVHQLTRYIQQLQADYGELLAQRRDLELELHTLCTGPGDRRFRIMHKERFESRIINYNDSELAGRARELRHDPRFSVEARIELLLVEIALLDRGSNQAPVRIKAHETELARLQQESRRFQLVHQEAELDVAIARQALDAAKAERIVLN